MNNKLLVLLIDGFRWDYFDIPGLELPGFNKIFREGVKAEYTVPDFPSLSFPNYYSLMTGLHVEDHGFFGNYMYHHEKGYQFEIGMKESESHLPFWFEGAEPIWITAEKQGKKTAMLEWPGGHVTNKNIEASYSKKMTHFARFPDAKTNLKDAIDMFKDDKIDMAGVFVDDVDHVGHSHGPNSILLAKTVKQADDMVKDLLIQVEEAGLKDKLNIVVFSDHGMTEVKGSVDITEFLRSDDIEAFANNTALCNVWPKSGKFDEVFTLLNRINHPHIKVYKKEDIPERWHYKDNPLVSPIVIVADLGWLIIGPRGMPTLEDGPVKGYHGFDNTEKDMRGIFLASGPDFQKNKKIGPISVVDIYQLMCKALRLQPLPHKGNPKIIDNACA